MNKIQIFNIMPVMKCLLVFIASSLMATVVKANTIDLICEISSSFTFSGIGTEKNKGKAMIHIYEDQLMKMIEISSDVEDVNNISVFSTKETMKNYTSFDESTDAKWDIQLNRSNGNQSSKTRIIIERTNGNLILDRSVRSRNKTVLIKASGTCAKIDSTKKKF